MKTEEVKGTEQEYWVQEPSPLHSEVARAICQTASCKATGPDEVLARTVQSRRRDSTGLNAQNMCGDLENWGVVGGVDVLHVHPTSQER